MTDFLRTPQTPERPVRLALIGDGNKAFVDYLLSLGLVTIQLPSNEKIDPSIANHADAQVFHLGQGRFFADSDVCMFLQAHLPQATVTPIAVQGAYPGDCKLNVLCVEKTAFAGKSMDVCLAQALIGTGHRLVPVHQGYAKCSAVAIGGNAILTDDASIAAASAKEGFDVLQIEKGDVRLSGHAYGFIGGACAMIDRSHLVFFGDLSYHRNEAQITAFLKKHGCRFDVLKHYPLTDIGGIVAVS